jgi:hypothetical protein
LGLNVPRYNGREGEMRVFLAAVLAAVVLAFVALLALNTTQRTAAAAYTSEGARINPTWSWRRVMRRTVNQAAVGQRMSPGSAVNPSGMQVEENVEGTCAQATALTWLFVDFGESATGDEGSECPA